MRLSSAIAGLLILICVALAGQTSALADPLVPVYGGILDFPTIKAPADPEEYSWSVELRSGQELRPIDDQNAAVYFEDGVTMESIVAADAHDATGAAVPTSLRVSEANVVTLTVHHQAGNLAKEGAPFVYPVTLGHAFEVGYSSVAVTYPPSERPPVVVLSKPTPVCVVPRITRRSLNADRKRLHDAGCKLGEVRGARSKMAKVIRQYPAPGTTRAVGSEVAVTLAG